MSDNVYKTLEITGSSKESIEDAIERAIARTGESVEHLRWFQVSEIRGHLDNGKVDYYQVTTKIGVTVEEKDSE